MKNKKTSAYTASVLVMIASTVFVIHCNFRTPHTNHMPAIVRRLFLYWLPRLLLIRRPMYRLRAGRKPYSRPRPLEETGYPVSGQEMTSNIGERARAIAAYTGEPEVRRRWREDDVENRSSSLLNDKELHRALEAVNFVAVHLKNDDEYAEVSDGQLLEIPSLICYN